MTSSLTWHQIEDPARKRKLENGGSSDFKFVWLEERGPGQKEEIKKRRGPMPSSESGIRREGPTTTKKYYMSGFS